MSAFTLSRLIWLEAVRRPRVVLAAVMLALSAGFLVLPDPGADYATLTLNDHPLAYSPAVMGFITGSEFTAFSGALGVLAMTVITPMATWRAVYGVTGAPAWKLALGGWISAFGVGLFLLTCIWAGALLRAGGVLTRSGDALDGLWIFSSWAFGLGMVGAAISSTIYSLLSMRLATRPGLFMGATFLAWVAILSLSISKGIDLSAAHFAEPRFIPGDHGDQFNMGVLAGLHDHTPVAARALGDLLSTPGGLSFFLSRLGLVAAGLCFTLALSGPRLRPLVARSRHGGWSLVGVGPAISARLGLTGVIFRQVWTVRLLTLLALAGALSFEVLHMGDKLGVRALGFAWGLYMLRWPELCAAFEHGALRSLIVPSVLGPWPIRLQLTLQITLQMAVLALPLALVFASAGRVHGLTWLGGQILVVPLICVALARLRGGATLFSLAAMAWWYLLVSGNLTAPAG
jgi:hypothetical protein